MKKLFLILLFIAPLYCLAQTSTSQDQPLEEFCLVKPETFLGSSFKARIDMGDKKGLFDNDAGKKLKDSNGDDVKFNSIVHILNYMSYQGWILTGSYGKTEEPTFVFKRPVKRQETPAAGNR